nr:hypothetical protein [Tanacetum cinerariifolium]
MDNDAIKVTLFDVINMNLDEVTKHEESKEEIERVWMIKYSFKREDEKSNRGSRERTRNGSSGKSSVGSRVGARN